MERSNPIWTAFRYFTLIVGVFVVLFPPYFLIVNAFKTPDEFFEKPTTALPDSFFHFANFAEAWKTADLGLALGNTAVILSVSLLLNVVLGSAFCYAVGRFDFKGKNALVGLFLFVTIIPQITTQVVNYKTIQALDLTNHLMGPTLIYIGADILQIYIYLQFIRNIPYELDEAAMMEGASLFRIYATLILPLLGPATATIVILKTIAILNDIYTPYLYMPRPENVVLATSLMRFFNNNSGEWQLISATLLMIMVPAAVLYLFLQRYIFAGVTNGAVKG